MKYIYSQDASGVVGDVADTIYNLLKNGKKVLWLLSGGSGGKVCIEIAGWLTDLPLENLFVTLSDERFVPVGDPDENWQQLLDMGLDLPGANLYRPLNGKDRSQTTADFMEWLNATKSEVDYTIGVFGIGSDGHTAGIKPGSIAVTSDQTAADFTGEDFERITITPTFIKTMDEAAVQVFGAEKHQVIAELLNGNLPVDQQPAQILKQVAKSTLYTDYSN